MRSDTFADAVFVCRKCVKRLGPQGKAIRKAVKRALRQRDEAVAFEEAPCFSICPKDGEVVATIAPGGARRIVILERPDGAADALRYLLAPT